MYIYISLREIHLKSLSLYSRVICNDFTTVIPVIDDQSDHKGLSRYSQSLVYM